MSVYQDIMNHLKSTGMLFVDDIMPYFVSSVGCHILNLRNKVTDKDRDEGVYPRPHPFYFRGRIADIRLHILFVAPPGWSKTYSMERFLDLREGLCAVEDKPMFSSWMMGKVTEAGLVGTVRDKKEGVEIVAGLAKDYCDGILAAEECSGLFQHGVATGSDLSDALLMLLDSGRVRKKLGKAEAIDYQTYFTLWGGTQPFKTRINVGSGIGRRFLIVTLNPTQEDWDRMRRAYRAMTGITPDWSRIEYIRKRLSDLYSNVDVTSVQFTPAYIETVDRMGLYHTELEVIDRLAIGYNFLRYYEIGSGILTVNMDETLYDLIRNSMHMRKDVMLNAMGATILRLMGDKEWQGTELHEVVATRIGIRQSEVADVMEELYRNGKVHITRDKSTGGRPKTVYKRIEKPFEPRLWKPTTSTVSEPVVAPEPSTPSPTAVPETLPLAKTATVEAVSETL